MALAFVAQGNIRSLEPDDQYAIYYLKNILAYSALVRRPLFILRMVSPGKADLYPQF
jgi:hypothetical protein